MKKSRYPTKFRRFLSDRLLDSDIRPVVGSVTGFTPSFVMCFSRRTNCAGLLPLWILLLAEGVVLDRKVADANTRRGEDRIR
jgi:hypothetical protein